MAVITEDQASKQVRALFTRGMQALERGNVDYAMDMFTMCLESEPRFMRARKYMRVAAISKNKGKKGGFFGKKKAIGGMSQYLSTMGLVKQGKGAQAVIAAEKLLRNDPLNPKYVRAFAEAADMADLPEAAIQTMELVREHIADDAALIDMQGDIYMKLGEVSKAKECFDKVCELKPNDPASIKKLKDALAMDSMSKDGWEGVEKGGSFRDMIKDSDEATLLEKQSKAVKTERDAESLIASTLAKMEAEPENINYYRELARLYGNNKRFDEALDVLQKAIEMNPGDPELDDSLTRMRVSQFDDEVATLAEAGDEEAAEAKELEKAQFVFDDLQHRVQRYPNDLRLKFDLGVMLFDNEYTNEAIQQFQQSQRSPKHRNQSLLYLAMCFKAKKQYDMAVQQLETAGSEHVLMDQTKKEILYQLGETHELMGDRDKALECFKQIYAVDIGYKDVSEKVEKGYEG